MDQAVDERADECPLRADGIRGKGGGGPPLQRSPSAIVAELGQVPFRQQRVVVDMFVIKPLKISGLVLENVALWGDKLKGKLDVKPLGKPGKLVLDSCNALAPLTVPH